MKIVIFLLSCIAAAVEAANIKTDENSVTLMNSKITAGLPVLEEVRKNHLVSVQLHKKHFCTGAIFSPNAVISTANCALLIFSHLFERDGERKPIVRVCFAQKLDDSSRCTYISRIAKDYLFGADNVQDLNGDPSIEKNLGLFVVHGNLLTPISEVIQYFQHELFLDDDNLRLTGWESKKKCSSSQDPEVYYINNHVDIEVKVMKDEECYQHTHQKFILPDFSKCIRNEMDGYFELEDIGSPVYDKKGKRIVLGIVSYIHGDKKTAVMQLLTSVSHSLDNYSWKIMTPDPLT